MAIAALSADPTDPRKARSRNRLLEAATALLTTGGIEAVTVDAVTRVSKVARTTLYRHFANTTHLLAATFEQLIPPVTRPRSTGSIRDRLIELLHSQSTRIDDAPLQLTMLAWLVLAPGKNPTAAHDGTSQAPGHQAPGHQALGNQALCTLRDRIIEQYRAPFDEVLAKPETVEQLGEFDLRLALLQLVGPVVLAKITGLKAIDYDDCARIVDDFLAGHPRRTAPPLTRTYR